MLGAHRRLAAPPTEEEPMGYRRNGLRALGLSLLAALGLMALGTSGAGASGNVLVEGLSPPFNVAIAGEAENALESNFMILSLNMEIFCHKSTITGAITNSGHGTATISLEECLAQGVSGGSLTGALCEIPDFVAKALALVFLHSGGKLIVDTTPLTPYTEHKEGIGDPYILFTAQDGLTFAKVLNHTECALPESVNVKGCFVAKIVTTGDQVTHLISSKGMLELFGCKINFGANESHFTREWVVSLAGEHKGLAWGAE
jgi:hypothetical protein